MSRNADENLPSLWDARPGGSRDDLEDIQKSAFYALGENRQRIWKLDWANGSDVDKDWNGRPVPPGVAVGTRVVVVLLKKLTDRGVMNEPLPIGVRSPYAVAYIQGDEVPEFPEEAIPVLADSHLDSITIIYEASYGEDHSGYPLIWKKVEEESTYAETQSESSAPRPRGRNLKVPKMSRKWPKKE